ncbi:hypothetical protein [Streptomyces atratus]|uniref:hypothetical protein n=1 Tax=Streptomyces atratus TaxID=1893 RepID=UPI0021A38021|nr:hypothetical protein [Streptomyces atratus]MCT2547379.1 hypothetical protein [Streptomyces atratus]
MTDRIPATEDLSLIDTLADTLYDHLYAITSYAEPHFADETEGLKHAVRAVLAESTTRIAELEAALNAIRHLHKDSPMGPRPVCFDGDDHAAGGDGLVSYPCPTVRRAHEVLLASETDPADLHAGLTPIPEPETDEQRADRLETERAHAAGDHQYCRLTCEVEMPSEMLRNFIIAKGYPGTAGALDELLRRAAATVPAT